jgi:hypothetical protein
MEKTICSLPYGKSSFIAEFNNAVDATLCENLITKLLSEPSDLFSPGITGLGVTPHIKKSSDVLLSNPNLLSKVKVREYDFLKNAEVHIINRITSCVHEYIHTYRCLAENSTIETTGVQIQRYFQNEGFYKPHMDSAPWMHNTDGYDKTRILAVILYLNTVEDGGETFFEYQDVAIKPERGKIVIFPTDWTYLHGGKVPYSSDKWISTSFVLTAVQEMA